MNLPGIDAKKLPVLPHLLIYAGSLPFICGALLLAVNITTIPLFGSVTDGVAAYGLIIVIFLSGIHWGQQLLLGEAVAGLFISSNILAVALWLIWMIIPAKIFISILPVPLVMIFIIDRGLCKAGAIDRTYLQSRFIITSIVILSLLAAAYLS